MSKNSRIKILETELRILYSEIFVAHNKTGLHAHHNVKLIRYNKIIEELSKISLKWKIKKFLRRIKYNGKN